MVTILDLEDSRGHSWEVKAGAQIAALRSRSQNYRHHQSIVYPRFNPTIVL